MKKHFFKLALAFALLANAAGASAQSEFSLDQRLFNDAFAVSLSVPKGFRYMENSHHIFVVFSLDKKFHDRKNICGGALCQAQSDDGNARVLYPYPYFKGSNEMETFLGNPEGEYNLKSLWRKELAYTADKELLNLAPGQWNKDWDKYIEVHAGDGLCRDYNADTVRVIDFPTDSVFFEKYTHCIGVYISRHDRMTTQFKILLTDEAYAHKQEWIDRVKGCVKYADSQRKLSVDEFNKAWDEYYKDSKKLKKTSTPSGQKFVVPKNVDMNVRIG